jgi:pyruvate dehydrogenase E1 component alpha subunit
MIQAMMLLIPRTEERLRDEGKAGNLPGAVHLYIGEEAIAAGVCANLRESDMITSTHRGHGHYLAKGGNLDAMMAEIWAKDTGICRGMGGSMHVADFSKGILGANGIVGAGFAIATGAAYSAMLAKEGRVVVDFFGDGSSNQGTLMESLNVSSLWQRPLVYVCEHNQFSEFSPARTVTSGEIVDRARAFKIPSVVVDGNDVVGVWEAARQAVERARQGGGPSFIEAHTYRIQGHLEAEDLFLGGQRYREPPQGADGPGLRKETRMDRRRPLGHGASAYPRGVARLDRSRSGPHHAPPRRVALACGTPRRMSTPHECRPHCRPHRNPTAVASTHSS